MTKPGIGIVIDYGEINAGLSAARGLANGFTKRKRTNVAITRIAALAEQEFAMMTDAKAHDELSHVYEYLGEETDEVDASPRGRLWRIDPQKIDSGIALTVRYEQSNQPGGPDPELRDRFPNMVAHRFPDKAEHLETRQELSARVGVNRYTTRVGGRAKQTPRALVFISHGFVRFAKYRNWRNRFYNKFTEHFQAYWQGKFVTSASSHAKAFTSDAGRSMARDGRMEVTKARPRSIPNPKRAVPGRVVALDQGRPFRGIKDNPEVVKRVEKKTAKSIAKKLVKAWRR